MSMFIKIIPLPWGQNEHYMLYAICFIAKLLSTVILYNLSEQDSLEEKGLTHWPSEGRRRSVSGVNEKHKSRNTSFMKSFKKKKKIHTNQRSIQEEGYQQWLNEMKDSSLHGIQKLSPGTHCSQSVQPSTKYWNQGMDLIFVHLNTCKISDHMLSAVFLVQWRYGIKSVSSSSPSASSCVLQ